MRTYLKKTICPYDCPTSCGFYVETDGEKITGVKPDKMHPASQGLICGKMQHYERSVNDKKRVMTPLRRTGKKGSGEFEPVSWTEAVKIITDRWKNIIAERGASAIVPCNYSGVMSMIQRNCGDAFFNYMGGREMVKTLCSSAKGAGYSAVVGKTGCLDPRELKDSDYYIIWGSQMAATRLQSMPVISAARKSGKKTVLVEVCGEGMAPYCDEMVLVCPGTDGALALAMMHVLKREGLTDEEFLKENTTGWDIFSQTLDRYTPAWAAQETGVPAAVIESLAIEYGRAKVPAIILGSGNSRYTNGGMTVRLITILSLVTGAWKQAGGGLCGCTPVETAYVDMNLVRRPDFRKKTENKLNINQLGNGIGSAVSEADKAYALYVYGSNPANSVSHQKAVYEGLEREDLFTVVHERFMTDTARYADIILPATFSVEQSDIYTAYGYCTLGTAKKVIAPPGECKSNWEVFSLLAEAMGYDETYFRRTEEEMLAYILAHPTPAVAALSAEDRQALAEGGTVSMPFAKHTLWRTDSRKADIVNNKMAVPVPEYRQSGPFHYPIRLVCVPAVETLNSIFLQREEQTARRGMLKLFIHPEDAKARGIENGDKICACNDLAEVVFEAAVTEHIAQGAAAAAGVYKSGLTFSGLAVNALHHDRLSDIGEATTMNDNTIEIRRITGEINDR